MTKICVMSKAVILKLDHASEALGGLVKVKTVRCHPRDSGSVRSVVQQENLHFHHIPR